MKHLVLINSQAFVGEKIVAVRHGDPVYTDRPAYTAYTLVFESGRQVVVGNLMGEVTFQEVQG